MIDFLYRMLFGWIEVTVSGGTPEGTISRLALGGLRLWGIRKTPGGYAFTLSLKGVPTLRHAVRGQHSRVRFGRRGGWPFKVREMRRRPFLGVGAVTALALIVFVTSRIWVVDAPGAQVSPAARAQIIQAAAKAGVHIGMARSRMNLNAERQSMQRALPQYAWIGLSVHGMLVTIHVIPLVNKSPDALPRRLVASHHGRVTSVLVFMGDPEVMAGEQVRKGQTLISGAVSAPLPLQPPGAAKPITDAVTTPAEGEVYANVRYQDTVSQPYSFWTLQPTGRAFEQVYVQFAADPPVLLKGYGAIPFRYYRARKFARQVRWRDVNLPVKEVKIVYNDLQRRHQTLSRKQALGRALAAVTHRMHAAVHGGTRVGEQRIVRWTTRGVSVQLIWTVNQNIAVPGR